MRAVALSRRRALEDQARIEDLLARRILFQRDLCRIARSDGGVHAVAHDDAARRVVLDQRTCLVLRRAIDGDVLETLELRSRRIAQHEARLQRLREIEVDLVEIDDVLRPCTRLDVERISRIRCTIAAKCTKDVLRNPIARLHLIFPVAEVDDVALDLADIAGGIRSIDAVQLAARDRDDIPRQGAAAPRIAAVDVLLEDPARDGDLVVRHIACGIRFFKRAAAYVFLQCAARDRDRVVRHIARGMCAAERAAVDLSRNRPASDDDVILINMPRRIRAVGKAAVKRLRLAAVHLDGVFFRPATASDVAADQPFGERHRPHIEANPIPPCMTCAPYDTAVSGGDLRRRALDAHRIAVGVSRAFGDTAEDAQRILLILIDRQGVARRILAARPDACRAVRRTGIIGVRHISLRRMRAVDRHIRCGGEGRRKESAAAQGDGCKKRQGRAREFLVGHSFSPLGLTCNLVIETRYFGLL